MQSKNAKDAASTAGRLYEELGFKPQGEMMLSSHKQHFKLVRNYTIQDNELHAGFAVMRSNVATYFGVDIQLETAAEIEDVNFFYESIKAVSLRYDGRGVECDRSTVDDLIADALNLIGQIENKILQNGEGVW